MTGRTLKLALRNVAGVLSDSTLPYLVLGVVSAAFVFAFVLDADPPVVYGVLILGCLAAIAEANGYFKNK